MESIGKYYCVICSKKGIATKKDLRRHLNFAHEKDIAKKTQCDNCHVPFFGIGKNHLKISHIVDCYLCVKTKICGNSNQKKPDVNAKINSEKHDCFICTQKNFPTNKSLIQHLSNVVTCAITTFNLHDKLFYSTATIVVFNNGHSCQS